MVMRNANAVIEVKHENLLGRCVRRPEELRMYVAEERMKVVLVTKILWNRWSRGLSFAKEMCFPKGGSCCKLRSECVTEKLSVCVAATS